uniref:AdoMet_MTases domain containing protein n=1 Tax=uncultured Caudovirales phage TaxID=2100421 RepID=A0A6J5L4B7_9CAUD|nr:hypothetical protein UFOVP114_32 [uncultured Caudovirales phage]
MSATGRNKPENARHPDDFYRTEQWCVDALYKALPMLPMPTLDPAAGDGALVQYARALGAAQMFGIELDHGRTAASRAAGLPVVQGDGLSVSWRGEHVLQNPPFYLSPEFVEKGVAEAETSVVLARLNFMGSEERHDWWKALAPWLRSVVSMSSRPRFIHGKGGDACEYGWFVFSREPLPGLAPFCWIARPPTARALQRRRSIPPGLPG